MYLGDFAAGQPVYFYFDSSDLTGTPSTMTSVTVSVYKNASDTQTTTGVTITADADSKTGFHRGVVALSADGTFFAEGSEFGVLLEATVNAVPMRKVIRQFSMGRVLSAAALAQIKAQVVAALITDTYAEPAAIPAATASIKDKIGLVAMVARNEQDLNKTTGEAQLYAANGSTVVGERTDSDDGTSYSKGGWV